MKKQKYKFKENPKLLIYELNEVPRKLINLYIAQKKSSAIAKLIQEGNIYDTYTKDKGELHPWSTWPTVHRGVTNEFHKIQFINQDLSYASKWPPIWKVLSDKGIRIGIFGSLQSYPPIINKNVDFFIPDTFSPTNEAYPKLGQRFQNLNLLLAGKNKAISRGFDLKDIKEFIFLFLNGGFKISSLIKIINHVIKEILNKDFLKRRSLMQPIVGFDIYMKLLKDTKPQFSTFFTNHVAGMMHRYWKETFPEDFGLEHKKVNKFNSKSIFKALDIADQQLSQLIRFGEKHNYDIWILSSMGQDFVERGDYIPEMFIKNLDKVFDKLGLKSELYKVLPAMQPDLCVECNSKEAFEDLSKNIYRVKDSSGNSILPIRYTNSGLKLNLSIFNSCSISESQKVYIDDKFYHLEELDIDLIKRDQGTGYHIPEGVFIYKGEKTNELFVDFNPSNALDTTVFFDKFKAFFENI